MWWLNSFFYFLLFMLGASISSFLAVLAYRWPRRLPWVRARSQCDHCRRQLSWWDNVPVFSYLYLGGRCRRCHQKIPASYFWWEVLGGILWCWWWQFFVVGGENWWVAIFWLVLGEILIFVSLVDCLKRYITTFWLLVLALLTIVYLFFLRLTAILSWQEILARGVMAILLWLFFVLVDWLACKVWRTQVALGSGDAFLIAILALWLPPVLSLMMLLLAFWSGALVGLVLLLRKKIFHRGDGKLAFIPFLVLGFFGALTYGDFLINLFWR